MDKQDQVPDFIPILSFKEVAQLLGTSAAVVRRLVVEAGVLPALRFTTSGQQVPFDLEYIRGVLGDRVSDDGHITATVPASEKLIDQGWREIPAGVLRVERSEVERYMAQHATLKHSTAAELIAERDRLRNELAAMKAAPPAEMNPKTRNVAAQIIAGLVLAHYGTSAHGGRINGMSEVLGELDRVGVSVSEDTLRRWLQEGAALIPPPGKT